MVKTQNIEICSIEYEHDADNTDEKCINLNTCDKLDILAVLMKTCSKAKQNPMNKNKQVIQDHIKKEKYYMASKVI